MGHEDLPYWLALRRAGLGSTNFSLLLAHFGDIRRAWEADGEEIGRAGLDRQFSRGFEKARAGFDAERELGQLAEHGIRAVTWLDDDFPGLLRDIPQSPPVLFVKGKAEPEMAQPVAVVGTRAVTAYGRQAAEHFCEAMARAGVGIVSGLARGVDAIAHRVALENGAPTVAVLAGGLDKVFPRENEGLARRIEEVGCLVSEYPPGIPARPAYFPRRNRILSGLSKAVLVVEAGEGSGALHTANWAFEQQRDVFAIPGSVFSRQSRGTNQLIRESTAKLVATPEQLLEELNLLGAGGQFRLDRGQPDEGTSVRAAVEPEPEEANILRQLGDGTMHIDEVARSSGAPVAAVSAALAVMELRGLVKQEGPQRYRKA
ncbi:MAG: DNA-processing protein DprA [Dehalococcoidia bacterium]